MNFSWNPEIGIPLGQVFTRVPRVAGEVVTQRMVKVSVLSTSPKSSPLARILTSSVPGVAFCTRSMSIDVGFWAVAVPKPSSGPVRPRSRPFQFQA